jgi:hypothetical protein
MDLGTRRLQILQDLRLFGLAEKEAVTLADVKRQRDRLLRRFHPDKGGTDEKAQLVNAVYGRLASRLQRKAERQRVEKKIRGALGIALVIGTGLFAVRHYSKNR